MKAVLLGGSGFIGMHLSRALADDGYEVIVYDCKMPVHGPARQDVRYVIGDFFVTHPPSLAEVLHGASLVYHLIWRLLPAASNRHMLSDVRDNLIGTLRLLDLCDAADIGRLIFFSSGGVVYGPAQSLPISETHPTDPCSSHGINKLAVEKYLALAARLHGLDYVILRPANPFGPYQNPHGGQGVIAAFLAWAAAGQPLEVWGDGSVIRDYFYVGDLARAAVLAGKTSHSRAIYNVGSGIGRSLNDVIAAIRELVGRDLAVVQRPGSRVDIPANVLDASKIRSLLGWSPEMSFAEGLRLTWRYFSSIESEGTRCSDSA